MKHREVSESRGARRLLRLPGVAERGMEKHTGAKSVASDAHAN